MGTKLMAPYSVYKTRNVANVSTDRILKLSPVEGAEPLDYKKRRSIAFSGMFSNTELHAIQDNGLWHLSYKTPQGYSAGAVPEGLKQRWTNFNQMRKSLDSYFAARNIKIEEVIA